MKIGNATVYVLYSYEDEEVKDVFGSLEKAQAWVDQNRAGNEEDIRFYRFDVDLTIKLKGEIEEVTG